MNLEGESFESKFEEAVDVEGGETPEKMGPLWEIRVEANGELDHADEASPIRSPALAGDGVRAGEGRGSVSPDEVRIYSPGDAEENGELVGADPIAYSSSSPIGSPLAACDEAVTPVSAASKGYGLKKWRRIRRDVKKDETDPSDDSAAIHKRRLPPVDPPKGREETKNESDNEDDEVGDEGSVASVELRNPVGTPIVVSAGPLDSELGRLVASGFAIGIDSDNSEDQSGKSSSAAASAPRLRHEIGFGRERSRIRNVGGRGLGHAVQHKGQRPRGGTESGKKAKDHPVKIDKDNSYSSVESDMKSTNAASAHWGSVHSNGKKSQESDNYGKGHSDDAQPSEEVRSGYHKENGEMEDLSRENLNANPMSAENVNKSENSQAADSYVDPLLDSISSLQGAQEALDNEIQIFKEIGKVTFSGDSDDQFDENDGNNSPVLEEHLVKPSQKIDQLKHKLEEELSNLKAKESKVIKLETILTETRQKEFEHQRLSALRQDCKELELETQNLLTRKLATETEIFNIKKATQNWKFSQEERNAPHAELKILAKDQEDLKRDISIAGSKANALMVQNEEILKKQLESTEIWTLQNEVCKYTLCSFVQVVMLCIALGLFLIRMLPSSAEFLVPT